MGRPMVCEQVGGGVIIREFPIAASQNFELFSGKFVANDGSGRVTLLTGTPSTEVDIVGWALVGDITSSATAGATKCGVNIDLTAIYEIPAYTDGTAISEATLQGTLGETLDIYVTGNVQYAYIVAAATYQLIVVDYQYYGSAVGQQTLFVKLNPKVISNTAYA